MKLRAWTGIALSVSVLGCAGNPAATSSQNAYGIPSTVAIAMPQTLKTVSALKSVSAYRTQAALLSMSQQLEGHMAVYSQSTKLVDGILDGVTKLNLTPGKPFTFKGADGQNLTVQLDVKDGYSVISVGQGTSATGENQIMGMSFTSRTKGKAVFKPQVGTSGMGRFMLATNFDLDAGKASADGYHDTSVITGGQTSQKVRAHWEFESLKGAAAADPSFALKVSAYSHKESNPQDSGIFALTANFLEAGGAAALVGLKTPQTGDAFRWVPSGENPSFEGDYEKAFYLSTDGKDLDPAQATAALKAIVPAEGSIYEPFPADPSQQDPLAEATFAFPR